MKKTITLIMMFVLSVGFLMAQGVFTYQAVVVDEDGNLVANQTVNATVTITYGDPEIQYTQTLTGIQTSRNGLALLSIGDKSSASFNAIDWATAKMKVDYTVTSDAVTVPAGQLEQVPAVPVALQSNATLTTPMIVEYIKGANMDDVRQIIAATEQGSPLLQDTVMASVFDTVKANFQLAKEVFLYYVSNATAADLQKLYDSLTSNTAVMAALDTMLVHFLKDSTELVYDILRAYALQLTPDDMEGILDAIPPTTENSTNIKSVILGKILEYLESPDGKTHVLLPVVMDYVKEATNDDLDGMIQAIMDNPNGVYYIMLDTFNLWMDQYFANHYTGGNNNSQVQSIVNDTMTNRYYACEEDVDLCQLNTDLNDLAACFGLQASQVVQFSRDATDPDLFVATINYHGTETFTVSCSVLLPTADDPYTINPSDITTTTTQIRIEIPSVELSPDDVTAFGWTITICSSCHNCDSGNGVTISGDYTD